MAEFRPPISDPIFKVVGDLFLPFALWWGRYEAIELDPQSVNRLRSLRGQHAILCPNHSHNHDPGMVYSLQYILGEQFRYLAAREIFDWWHGILGALIQRVGAYSVERNAVDRKSIMMTLKIILEGKYKLVVFPEGQISHRNDRVLPIDESVSSLFLRAATALHKAAPREPLYVVPIGLIYRYVEDISANLSNALVRIERTLAVGDHSGSLLDRFYRARTIVLDRVSSRHGFQHQDDLPFEDLVGRLGGYGEAARLRALLAYGDIRRMTPELLAGGVDLIEGELYTRVTQKGHRRVRVRVGEPIDIVSLLPQYRHDRHATSAWLSQHVEKQLLQLLGTPVTAPLIAA